MSGSSDSIYSTYFMLENIWHHHFTWSGLNSQEIVNFVPILGPPGPELNWNKFTISCEFGPLQEKWWCYMFSIIKMEEYIKPERSGIFWAKMVAKLSSPETHFMHMRVNTIFVFTYLFLKVYEYKFKTKNRRKILKIQKD